MFREAQRYTHINPSKREALYLHYSAGIGVGKIAELLGVHRSTVYRELARNKHTELKAYLPDSAQKLSIMRRNRPGAKIKRFKQLQQKIQDGFAMFLSPEVIAGRLKQEQFEHTISHESIYKWIYGEAKEQKLYECLLRRKRHRGFRPCKKTEKTRIPNRISIHERPDPPPNQMGHWEGDTVHFSKGKGAIVTLYDKATKVLFGAKMTSRKTSETIDNIITIMQHLPTELRRSMTFDNGNEFTEHERLQRTFGLKTYFCDTYSSWQKGGVENANGILRRYIPKASNDHDYSPEQVQSIIHRINMTPRKSLDFKSPYEILLQRLTKQNRIIPLFNPLVALRL